MITWQEQGFPKIGTYFDEEYGLVLDERDRYEVPLGYNSGVEGFISVTSGSDLTLDIYENDGDLYDSYSVGSSPVSFNFQSDTFTMEIYPSNVNVLTEYSLELNIGQVYDPF